ncbi:MAG: hypothetical protein COW18_10335 [Zetaproteobacteria bacterium CG12_big_fil_rev_8_21_14_0_65_54_13]|nr:MAG: hypothetical protein COW18_10335 [Zetaproteobacteria bacterium CG12_big_fil_rev_8_21_14_0_65_54_13]PIX53447.1 MAG: hypothetical protein COZ50_13255 [Zetaproteobacteria bacterium CG_4_10_14_3_um_filter_54_28]PJA29176.1 MAG: hypothetical protein CO188_07210 [Zetaproteobacteria bacterium CG_4_9_14_3_um_filter_54_145]
MGRQMLLVQWCSFGTVRIHLVRNGVLNHRHGMGFGCQQAESADQNLHSKQPRHQAGETSVIQLIPQQHGTQNTL